MGWITRITDWWWIMKNNQKSLTIITDKYKAEAFIKNSSRIAKLYHKKSAFRNAIAWHQRDIRKKYPYKVQDYSVAKALYEQYWMIPEAIASYDKFLTYLLKAKLKGERVFICRFRARYPVRSNERYFINISGSDKPTTLEVKLEDVWPKGNPWPIRIIQARHAKGKWEKFYIEPDQITQYVWADNDQILSFEEREIQYNFLAGERARVREELSKIEQEIQAI